MAATTKLCSRRCGLAFARRILRGVRGGSGSRSRSRHARGLERIGEALHVRARVVRADRHAQRRSHRAPLLRNAVRHARDNAGLEELRVREGREKNEDGMIKRETRRKP